MEIKVEIEKTLDSSDPKKPVAFADVFIGNTVVIHDVRLYLKDGKCSTQMPSKQWTDKNGEKRWRDIAHPVSASARNEINIAAGKAYDAYLQDGSRH